LEGFQFIGIEREEEYIKIAKARIDSAFVQQDLFAA
jgi:DNA modification methylase